MWARRVAEREEKRSDRENTGCVVLLLFWTQAGLSAVLEDVCARSGCAWPWRAVYHILTVGFRIKDWLLPGNGGLHEAAWWIANLAYLWVLALVIRSIARYIADSFRRRSAR